MADWARSKNEHTCGHPREVCSDPKRDWYPQRYVCHVAMETAAANRRYDALHEKQPFHDGTFSRWSEKATAATPYHFHDGVTVYVAETDLNPNDDFLGGPR